MKITKTPLPFNKSKAIPTHFSTIELVTPSMFAKRKVNERESAWLSSSFGCFFTGNRQVKNLPNLIQQSNAQSKLKVEVALTFLLFWSNIDVFQLHNRHIFYF